MLRSRKIVYLLVDDGDLVKTLRFKSDKYIGDPINAIKIFNEKEVDELIMLDISATRDNKDPDFNLIKSVAKECTMPFGYGGGINNVKDASKIIVSGAEKIILGEAIFHKPGLINEISNNLGSQSVAAVLNYKKNLFGKHNLYVQNGEKKINDSIENTLMKCQNEGAGELILYNIDRDGTRQGYDFSLIDLVYPNITVPISIVGGVGDALHFDMAEKRYDIIGMGAGSFFTLVGKYKAVLINYSV